MFRFLQKARYAHFSSLVPLFSSKSSFDSDKLDSKQENSEKTGKDRLRDMFTLSEFDEISVELNTVIQSSLIGAFFGASYGGLVRSREAYLYFIETNQATIFKTTTEAKRKLQDCTTLAFARGAYHWGWRLSFFCGTFALISTSISVYRGHESLLEYLVAGALTGGLYRCNLGVPGALVGAGLGFALSAVAGSVIMLLLKITGVSMDDIRKSLHKIKEARVDQYRQLEETSATIKHDDYTKHHEYIVETHGEKKLEDL